MTLRAWARTDWTRLSSVRTVRSAPMCSVLERTHPVTASPCFSLHLTEHKEKKGKELATAKTGREGLLASTRSCSLYGYLPGVSEHETMSRWLTRLYMEMCFVSVERRTVYTGQGRCIRKLSVDPERDGVALRGQGVQDCTNSGTDRFARGFPSRTRDKAHTARVQERRSDSVFAVPCFPALFFRYAWHCSPRPSFPRSGEVSVTSLCCLPFCRVVCPARGQLMRWG